VLKDTTPHRKMATPVDSQRQARSDADWYVHVEHFEICRHHAPVWVVPAHSSVCK